MKFFRLLKLSHRSLTSDKKRTLLTIIVVGSLFSILVALQFIIQGIENTVIKNNKSFFSDKTYLIAMPCNHDQIEESAALKCNNLDDEEDIISCLQEIAKQPLPCANNEVESNHFFNERVLPYGGKIVANARNVSASNSVIMSFYPVNQFEHQIKADIKSRPANSIPVLINPKQAAELIGIELTKSTYTDQEQMAILNKVQDKTVGQVFDFDGVQIFVAGLMPYGKDNLSLAKYDTDFRVIDLVLDKVSFWSNNIFYLDDQSPAIKDFIKQTNLHNYYSIIEFDDPYQAYAYYNHEYHRSDPQLFAVKDNRKANCTLIELGTNSIDVIYNFKTIRFVLSFANYILLIAAVVIITFTFLRLISQDNRLIALYRSLGASGLDVLFIYFYYVVELCLLTIIYTIAVGAIIAVIVSYYYSADLNTSMSLFFAHEIKGFILLVGFNREITQILLVILVAAPLTSLLTADQLSMKNIAKRLKKV